MKIKVHTMKRNGYCRGGHMRGSHRLRQGDRAVKVSTIHGNTYHCMEHAQEFVADLKDTLKEIENEG